MKEISDILTDNHEIETSFSSASLINPEMETIAALGLELIKELNSATQKNLSKRAKKSKTEKVLNTDSNSEPQESVLDIYNRRLKISPSNENVLFRRANYCFERGKFIQAVEDYSTLIKLDPNFQEYYIGQGKSYLELTNYDKAIHSFTTGIGLDFEKISWYGTNGKSFKTCKRPDLVKFDIHRRLAKLYFLRGSCYFYIKKYNFAIADLNISIEIEPHDCRDSHYILALVYFELKETTQALFHLKVASNNGSKDAKTLLEKLEI